MLGKRPYDLFYGREAGAGRTLFGGRRSLHSGFDGLDGALSAAGALAFERVAAFGFEAVDASSERGVHPGSDLTNYVFGLDNCGWASMEAVLLMWVLQGLLPIAGC